MDFVGTRERLSYESQASEAQNNTRNLECSLS